MTIEDEAGRLFDGVSTCHLTVPPKAMVGQYCSATACNCANHAPIRGQKWSGRYSQNPGLVTNADGSVDIRIWKLPDIGTSNGRTDRLS